MGRATVMAYVFILFLLICLQSTLSVFSFATPLTKHNQFHEEQEAARRRIQEFEDNAEEVHCSRERSRAAWEIIVMYMMPFVEREKYEMPQKCPLHPDNDLFREQEQHKIHVDLNEWRCGYCKKIFRAEKFLDKHFDNRHYNLLNTSQSKCLADYCGALHCDLASNSKKRKTKCNPAAASKNRHTCEGLANTCFPVNQGPSANRLHELFLRQFCDSHVCSGGPKPFSHGGRKHQNLFYLAFSILTLLLLPVFYVVMYLYHREMKTNTQQLRRISRKTKPS